MVNYINTEYGDFYDRVNNGNVIETAEEYYERWIANKDKQIDTCSTKTVEERLEEAEKENKQLWETVEFLLKNTGFIPGEEIS